MQSIVSYKNRGIGGNSYYRGNCPPRFIEDLIDFYKVKNISDYMCGSGTTKDVADIIEKAGGKIELHNIYQQVSGYKKAEKIIM